VLRGALDIAFRLLDSAQVKKALQAAADPLIRVTSGDIYRAIVRHGYDGIDQRAFHPLIRVRIGGHRYPGWIHIPGQAARNPVMFREAMNSSSRPFPAISFMIALAGRARRAGRSGLQGRTTGYERHLVIIGRYVEEAAQELRRCPVITPAPQCPVIRSLAARTRQRHSHSHASATVVGGFFALADDGAAVDRDAARQLQPRSGLSFPVLPGRLGQEPRFTLPSAAARVRAGPGAC
jgi:hypothetical protein